MSRRLSLELSDRAFSTLRTKAEATGVAPADLATRSLEREYTADPRSEIERQAARERFDRCIGSVDLGHPIGLENEGIDSDLAEEYAADHENG